MKDEVRRTKDEKQGIPMRPGLARSGNGAKNHSDRRPPFDICERTFDFALNVIDICETVNERPGVCWTLSKQLLRAGTSVGANIEEGKAAQSRADFISKYSIARKEARETRFFLRLLRARRYATNEKLDPLIAESEELIRILTTIIMNASV
jgi:four helix bundle protein